MGGLDGRGGMIDGREERRGRGIEEEERKKERKEEGMIDQKKRRDWEEND